MAKRIRMAATVLHEDQGSIVLVPKMSGFRMECRGSDDTEYAPIWIDEAGLQQMADRIGEALAKLRATRRSMGTRTLTRLATTTREKRKGIYMSGMKFRFKHVDKDGDVLLIHDVDKDNIAVGVGESGCYMSEAAEAELLAHLQRRANLRPAKWTGVGRMGVSVASERVPYGVTPVTVAKMHLSGDFASTDIPTGKVRVTVEQVRDGA